MSHKLQSHYQDFGGLDTRTNALVQNPKSARGGTNFRFNYQDELCKRLGFSQKVLSAECEWGLFEYRYQDLNTGEEINQILGVDALGNLNRLLFNTLHMSVSGGSVASYSFYWSGTAWIFSLHDSSDAVLGSITVLQTDTLSSLSTAINALALSGLTSSITNGSGTSVFAYLLDWAYLNPIQDNDVNFWQVVPTPTTDVLLPQLPLNKNDPNYEGPNGVNANNCFYLTDGCFVVKYDGYSVYRAGLPKVYGALTAEENFSGFKNSSVLGTFSGNAAGTASAPIIMIDSFIWDQNDWTVGDHVRIDALTSDFLITSINTGTRAITLSRLTGTDNITTGFTGAHRVYLQVGGSGVWSFGTHNFLYQFCYRDPSGTLIRGKAQNFFSSTTSIEGGCNYASVVPIDGATIKIRIPSIRQDLTFPVYSCQLGAGVTVSSAAATVLTVNAGHNIKVGMALRIHEMDPINGFPQQIYYVSVTAVSATTVTITGFPGSSVVMTSGQVLNGAYVSDEVLNKNQYLQNSAVYGAYVQIMATKGYTPDAGENVEEFQPYYELSHFLPLPSTSAQEYSVLTGVIDEALVVPFDRENLEQVGAELPRACTIISDWQEQLVQGARTINPDVANDYYPSIYDPVGVLSFYNDSIEANRLVTYTEALLCDFQSIYWADSNTPEGFPQDGLSEIVVKGHFNDQIRGIGVNKTSLFALKDKTTGYLTGTLADNSLNLEIMESKSGCIAHKTVQSVNGETVYMDLNNGFWSIIAGRLPKFLGYPIQDYFKTNSISKNFNFRRAKATNLFLYDQYICYIPGVSPITFVLDYAPLSGGSLRSCWYPWSGFDASGGILATGSDDLFIGNASGLMKQKRTGSRYDISDQKVSIDFKYIASWINFGMPVIDKKFAKTWINSIQGAFTLTVKQYMNYLDNSVSTFDLTFPSTPRDTVKDFVNLNVDKISGHSLSFENNIIFEDVKIQGWEIEYAADFDHEEGRK